MIAMDSQNQILSASFCSVGSLLESIVSPREVFKDEESFVKTVLHEIGHNTGHEKRLNREYGKEFGSEKYAQEELVAELSGLFVESDLGLNLQAEHYEDHSDYLKSWISALKNDYPELFTEQYLN